MGSGDSNAARGLHRRVSRTDLDFEQALRAEGTVMLKEGLDVNSLGADTSPSPVNRSFSMGSPDPPLRSTPRSMQPSTPTVVPPTPTPVAGPSSGKLFVSSSPASSSHDVFYDPEDTERQINRRSMYRSPGTSSSPDLATLLRKAKERGGVVGTQHIKETRRESPPPLPPGPFDRPHNGGRARSSTQFYSPPPESSPRTPLPKKKSLHRSSPGEDSPDWVMASPRPKENGSKVSYQDLGGSEFH